MTNIWAKDNMVQFIDVLEALKMGKMNNVV